MSVVEPLPAEVLDRPEYADMMARARELMVPDDMFFRIMAHVPGYAEAVFDAMHYSHAGGSVDHGLKEIIRVQLARTAGDGYSAALRSVKAKEAGLTEDRIEAGCGDFENDPGFSDAEKWALRYAYLMYREPGKLDRSFYDQGKKHYSEAEIVELGAFIALHYGMQVFLRTLRLAPA